MNETRRKKIVNDILVRQPKGDKGVKPTFRIEEYYCYDAHRHKKRVHCDHPGWGYADETLWDLGFRNEADIRDYIFETFYKSEDCSGTYYLSQGKKAGVTRKTNRVWARIASALRRVQKTGNLPGLYEVRVNWETNFYFYGNSVGEIETLAETMLRPIFNDESFTVTFVDRSVPGDVLDKNIRSIKRIENEVANCKNKAEKLLKQADESAARVEYVKTLITQNLDVAMRAS
tara:strand:- start:673 stop:1365 length:693 start_codon:yes stop_codon:yes gene_type:complete